MTLHQTEVLKSTVPSVQAKKQAGDKRDAEIESASCYIYRTGRRTLSKASGDAAD